MLQIDTIYYMGESQMGCQSVKGMFEYVFASGSEMRP